MPRRCNDTSGILLLAIFFPGLLRQYVWLQYEHQILVLVLKILLALLCTGGVYAYREVLWQRGPRGGLYYRTHTGAKIYSGRRDVYEGGVQRIRTHREQGCVVM